MQIDERAVFFQKAIDYVTVRYPTPTKFNFDIVALIITQIYNCLKI